MSARSHAVGEMRSLLTTRSLSIVVALIVIVAALWVGIRASETEAELVSRRTAWEQLAIQLSTVQREFQAPTPREAAALIAESSRLSTLGATDGDQLNVIDAVTRLAEAASLGNVRVSSVPADSGHHAERHVEGVAIRSAGYQIAVEFDGSFARAMEFVSSLPSSVSLTRLTVARRPGTPAYEVFLSVYEIDAKPGN